TGGGIVFSAGSLTFGGSLVVDSRIQQIVRNALSEAFVETPRLSIARHSSAVATISLRGRLGLRYVLQGSPTLASGSWEDIAVLDLRNSVVERLDVPVSRDRYFYRAVQVP